MCRKRAAGTLGLMGPMWLFYYYGRDDSLPRISDVRDYQPPLVTQILDRRGALFGVRVIRRQYV